MQDVLILVDKRLMGDTFPQSFDCLDLRLSYDKGSQIFLSTVIHELGRMCRYAKLSADGSFVQNIPYALVGAHLFERLKMALDISPAINAISCNRVDSFMKNSLVGWTTKLARKVMITKTRTKKTTITLTESFFRRSPKLEKREPIFAHGT